MRYDYEIEDHRRQQKELVTRILLTVLEVLIVVLVAFLITRFGFETIKVSGSSMSPTLASDDTILINKMSYKLHSIKRNDIVVIKQSGSEHNFYMIERVIGLPGETVKIDDGQVYINGELLEEKYDFPVMENGGLALEDITLDDDEYFTLCDNRNEGEDSRNANVGNILKKDIVGKAWIRTNSFAMVNFINGFGDASSGDTSSAQ